MTYSIVVIDNYHIDEPGMYEKESYVDLELAQARAREIVDEFLLSAVTPGMSAEGLWSQWVYFGDNPIVCGGDTTSVNFDAWVYVKERCQAMYPGQESS
jgi:hypothetical protein